MSSANFLPLVVRITYPVMHSEASGCVTDGSGCTEWKLETFEELTFKNFVVSKTFCEHLMAYFLKCQNDWLTSN